MTGSDALLAFGFIQLPMLWWLGAAAAPVLIHLWNRRRYREVSWAAMQYLLAAVRKNSRRILVEQWLLLAVRTLIIILLVLAVSEFYLEMSGRKFVAGRRTHKVLVLDGSFSMDYQPADATRFERAQQLAAEIIDGSTQGDGFTVVLLSSPPRVVVPTPAFERESLIEEIEDLVLPHGTADLPATLAEVEKILIAARRDQPRLEQEEVYFLTDLGRVGWQPDLPSAADTVAFRERSKRLGEQAHLVLIDLGQPGSDNLAVTSLRTPDAFCSLARDAAFEAEVQNLGRQSRQRQLLEFFVDGRRTGESYVDVEPGQRATAAFSHRFDAPGDHVVEARLAGDLLKIDNRRWLSVPVKEFVRVLCIDGQPAGGEFRGAADYLSVALAPLDEERALVRPETAPESALVERDLSRYDCIFLCNVAQFTSNEAAVLASYVQAGGGLVFFLGDQAAAASYNQHLAGEAPGSLRILPVRLGETVAESRYTFDPLEYKHPIVSPFRGQERSGLLTTQVSRYIRLELPAESNAKVALAFSGGDPAIVEEAFGRGRTIVVATSADVSWTTMPAWPSYVPVVQELLAAAVAGAHEERNVEAGQAIGSVLRGAAAGVAVEVQSPPDADGEKRLHRETSFAEGDEERWLFDDTWQSGPYRAALGAPVSRTEAFAVNVNTAESNLEKLTLEELQNDVWPDVEFTYNTVWRNLNDQPAGEIGRRSPFQRWFLYPALMLLLCEPLMAWFFGHQKA